MDQRPTVCRPDRGGTFAPGGPFLTIVDVRDRRLRDRGRGDGARGIGARFPAASRVPPGRRAGRAVPLVGRRARSGRAARIGVGVRVGRRRRRVGHRVRVRPAGGVAREPLAAHRGDPGDRRARRRRDAPVAGLSRRLLLHRVRQHRRDPSREPVHPDTDRLPGRRGRQPGRSEVALDAGGLRAVVHGLRVGRGPAGGLRVRTGRGVPDDGARGEPRHAGADRHDGAPDPAVAGGVRRGGVRDEPRRAVPVGRERPQRPAGGARRGRSVRAGARPPRPARGVRP